jgi:hypothetical protein
MRRHREIASKTIALKVESGNFPQRVIKCGGTNVPLMLADTARK